MRKLGLAAMAMGLLIALDAGCGATAPPTPTITALEFPLRPIRATTTGPALNACQTAVRPERKAFSIPRLLEAVPNLQYDVWPILPVQLPLGEPVPITVVLKSLARGNLAVPNSFAYAVVITDRDGAPVSWWMAGGQTYEPITPGPSDGSPPENGTRLHSGSAKTSGNVAWDQRDFRTEAGRQETEPCVGQPGPAGDYLVWVLVPTRAGQTGAVREALTTAPDRLVELGWLAAEPHELELGGPGISCTARIQADELRHIEVLRQIKRRYRDSLMAVPGVTSLGVGVVRQVGQQIAEIGIIVFIDPKLPPDRIDPQGLIPNTLEGCTVTTKTIHPQPAGFQ